MKINQIDFTKAELAAWDKAESKMGEVKLAPSLMKKIVSLLGTLILGNFRGKRIV